MQTLTVGASSLEVAQQLCIALSDFQPEVIGSKEEGYGARVSLAGGDQHIVAVLNAIVAHVAARNDGPARVDFGGRKYTLHPESAA
jgi:hypothetical protein